MKANKTKVIARNFTLTQQEMDLGNKLININGDRSFSALLGRLIRDEASRKGIVLHPAC